MINYHLKLTQDHISKLLMTDYTTIPHTFSKQENTTVSLQKIIIPWLIVDFPLRQIIRY